MAVAEETEADLMVSCGHLYVSIALESFATTLMSLSFSYLLLLITNKGRLASPGRAALNFIGENLRTFYTDVTDEVCKWPGLHHAPLAKRFAFCRKSNQTVCVFQILICVLTVERWLHIQNINGFRYLGYAMTCPPMQTQLIILIAPVVPCYKLMCVFTYIITTAMLLFGYGASLLRGEVYTGDLLEYAKTWRWEDAGFDRKGVAMLIPTGILVFLTFVQIPYLAFLYVINGGDKKGLPHNYLKLLTIVAVTWVAFPVWWILSFEGKVLIKDTKMNAIGFALLNIVSKGCFTVTLIGITKWHKKEQQKKDYLEKGSRGDEPAPVEEPQTAADDVAKPRRAARSETWVVGLLRPFDEEDAPPQAWAELEATFRAFLVGNGVTPASWKSMSGEQRAILKEEYDSTMDMVVADDANSMWQADKSFANTARGSAPKVEPAVPASDPEPDFGDDLGVAVEEPEQHFEGHPEDEVGMSAEQVRDLSKKIKVGQTITTLYNVKGRVLRKVTTDRIQLAVKGKPAQTVRVEDVTILKVIFLSARGLEATDFSATARAFCTCSIQGRPNSEARGALAPQGPRAAWAEEEEVDLLGYTLGDSLTVRLWAQQPHSKAEELLGEGIVSGSDLADGGFEGEIRLSASGRITSVYLSLLVVIVNLPERLELGEEEE